MKALSRLTSCNQLKGAYWIKGIVGRRANLATPGPIASFDWNPDLQGQVNTLN